MLIHLKAEISFTCSNHVEIEAYKETFSKVLEVLHHSAENRRPFHAMGKTGKKRPINNCIGAYRFAVDSFPLLVMLAWRIWRDTS